MYESLQSSSFHGSFSRESRLWLFEAEKIYPKCHDTGRTTFTYTVNCKVEFKCNYDGGVNGIVRCCDGIQVQSEEKELTNDNVRNALNWFMGDTMHHTFKALGTIAAAMAVLGHASAKKLTPTELQALFSNTTVKFTTKRAKVALWLMSDGKARSHTVLAQRENKQHGIWWIKEPNIHCLNWSQQKKNFCRPVDSVEKSGKVTQLR